MDTSTRHNRELINWYRQSRASTPQRAPFRKGQVIAPNGAYFDVVLEFLEGDNGTAEESNKYKYNVFNDQGNNDPGNLIEAEVMFQETDRHEYKTYELGEVDPGTWGRAYINDDDELIVVTTNERLRLQACEPTEVESFELPLVDLTVDPALTSASLTFSARLNGSTSHVDIGNPADLQGTGAKTVCAWIRTDSAVGSSLSIASKFETSGNQRSWYLLLPSAVPGQARFIISDNGTNTKYAESAATVNDGDWHHVAAVYDPSVGIYVYIDRIIDGTETTSVYSSLHNSTADVSIGARNHTANFFDGDIRDVRIYDRALANFEIDQIYRGTSVTSDLVGRWQLGTNAEDSSDNSNDGSETDIAYRSN